MQLAMIGLGRMGANMVRRLLRGGHTAVVFDPDAARVAELVAEGAVGATSLDDLVAKLDAAAHRVGDGAGGRADRAGGARPGLAARGGRRRHRRRQHLLQGRRAAGRGRWRSAGFDYVDVGTSGGVWGLERGYCLMIGGPRRCSRGSSPIFRTLAPGRRRSARRPGSTRRRTCRPGPGGLSALRAGGRGSLREDGPQRHRVRPHAGLRRGLRHPAQRARREAARGRSATTFNLGGRRRAVAPRQRRRRRGCST